LTVLSRNDSAGDIETLEYCYTKLQDTMGEDKKQRLQDIIRGLKNQEERESKQGRVERYNKGTSYIPPAL
jgi:hypothetical protein